jgi:peptidoglycan hydrolase CwlO-like protein
METLIHNLTTELTESQVTKKILQKENTSLCEQIGAYQKKCDALQDRVKQYGIDAPCLKRDLMLVCPSWHKSL